LIVVKDQSTTGDNNEKTILLVQYQEYLQRKWLEPATIQSKIKRLSTIYGYDVDFYNPDEVAVYLVKMNCSSGYKANLIFAYDDYVEMMGWEWNRPKVNEVKKPIRVPLETDIDQLIAGCHHVKGAFLQLLKETGMRPSVAFDRKWDDIDFRTKQIHITPKKRGNPRSLPISEKLLAMLNQLEKNNEYLFKTTTLKTFSDGFRKQRKRVAVKLGNPEIKKINFKSLRHYYATKLYREYKDLKLCQYALGHKSTKHTEVYTHIVGFPEHDSFIVKAVTTAEEAIPLIEQGYHFDSTTPDGYNLYKKRK